MNEGARKVVVGVTGINATENPGPGVGIARSLRESIPNIKILGLSYDVHDPGHYMDFVFDRTSLLSYPTHGWTELKKGLLEAKAEYGLDILIPSLDSELPLFIHHAEELKELGIEPFLPSRKSFEQRSKENLAAIAEIMGIQTPKTRCVFSEEELKNCINQDFTFPVYIKGASHKANLVTNMAQSLYHFLEISNEWGFPILIQEVVYGTEVNLIGLGDGTGSMCGFLSITKKLTSSQGKIWTGITIENPDLEIAAQRFVQNTKWKGPFELECIQTKQGLKLIEINPRFPAWVYFATGCGINLPKRLFELITLGNCDRSAEYPAGKFLVRYTYELVTNIDRFQELSMRRG